MTGTQNALAPRVLEREGVVYATSSDLADFFDKRHDHILRDIDRLTGHSPDLGDVKDQALTRWFLLRETPPPTIPGRKDRASDGRRPGAARQGIRRGECAALQGSL